MIDRASFFADENQDRDLKIANGPLWDVLIRIIEEDRSLCPSSTIVDVGCHSGGFLDRVISRWSLREVYAIEPVERLRFEAAALLAKHPACSLTIEAPENWKTIPTGGVDLITCQEVLYLVSDLPGLFREFRQVLTSGGAAYLTLGCHVENPLWYRWREVLIGQGIEVFDHEPLKILSMAEDCGFWPSIRPLRTDGWISYAPSEAQFPVGDVASLIAHHFRHKLLFRFEA